MVDFIDCMEQDVFFPKNFRNSCRRELVDIRLWMLSLRMKKCGNTEESDSDGY